eukprot:TRINITY_DN847_c0_g1_i5.p1 TRINITY_DN847_c0_g1~~TRINITY_DN847_c0_g1_i5.p1  ORF type:complete len:160 (+),score=15.91 TRINITY_DN847_c0_g1_i5:3-482(+)
MIVFSIMAISTLTKKWFNRTASRKKLQIAQKQLLDRYVTGYTISHVPLASGDFINTFDAGNIKAKKTVVMAHGFGAGLGFFMRNYGTLSQNGRIISFDWLGMGGSSRPKFTKRTVCSDEVIEEVCIISNWVLLELFGYSVQFSHLIRIKSNNCRHNHFL